MASAGRILFGLMAASLICGPPAVAQKAPRPAPAAADWAALAKLPDFNGVWEVAFPAAAGRGAAQPRARGVTGGAAAPALTPAYAAKAQAMASQPKAEDNLSANCLPPGMPGIMSQPYPIEILPTPGQVTIVIEAYTQVRHIYTDGRALPDDPDPTFFGTSVGRWEDNTLVVETVGFAQVPRGLSFPYSDKMRIQERFRLADADTLTIETSIADPEALKTPYSMGARTFKRHRNWTIAEYICEENNRNFVDEKGKAGINLANPEASPR
jgi:hypothetical protein